MPKKHSQQVADRFVKAMKQIIADQIGDVTTRSDFAIKIGIHKQNLSKIEDGSRAPTTELLCKMCLDFGVDPGWLLIDRGNMFGVPSSLENVNILNRLTQLEKIVGKQIKAQAKKAS